MKNKVNQEQRAFLAWAVLTRYAANAKPITYGDLAKQLNMHHRPIRFVLGLIQDYCLRNQLPPLSILVLNKKTGLPGHGFIAYDIENAQDGINKVYGFDWTSISNPFEYAQVGTREHELINELLVSPKDSKDVYALVKVRGTAQRIFRQALLRIYNSSCAICGLTFEEALEGAHIIPYSQSDSSQRLDVTNGILLCSNHHRLFDAGYIFINNDYLIQSITPGTEIEAYSEFDRLIVGNFHGKKLRLPKEEKHYPNKECLSIHRYDG